MIKVPYKNAIAIWAKFGIPEETMLALTMPIVQLEDQKSVLFYRGCSLADDGVVPLSFELRNRALSRAARRGPIMLGR